MGKRWEQHSDMCGCERCARQAESENPRPVFDEVEDPNVLDCGCDVGACQCAYWDSVADEVEYREEIRRSFRK